MKVCYIVKKGIKSRLCGQIKTDGKGAIFVFVFILVCVLLKNLVRGRPQDDLRTQINQIFSRALPIRR